MQVPQVDGLWNLTCQFFVHASFTPTDTLLCGNCRIVGWLPPHFVVNLSQGRGLWGWGVGLFHIFFAKMLLNWKLLLSFACEMRTRQSLQIRHRGKRRSVMLILCLWNLGNFKDPHKRGHSGSHVYAWVTISLHLVWTVFLGPQRQEVMRRGPRSLHVKPKNHLAWPRRA